MRISIKKFAQVIPCYRCLTPLLDLQGNTRMQRNPGSGGRVNNSLDKVIFQEMILRICGSFLVGEVGIVLGYPTMIGATILQS